MQVKAVLSVHIYYKQKFTDTSIGISIGVIPWYQVGIGSAKL